MAEITALFSGPVTAAGHAGHALSRAGLKVEHSNLRHGLDDEGPTVGWLTVTGDERNLDAAVSAAARLGWQLRLHWPAVTARRGLAAAPQGPQAVEALTARVQRLELALAAR